MYELAPEPWTSTKVGEVDDMFSPFAKNAGIAYSRAGAEERGADSTARRRGIRNRQGPSQAVRVRMNFSIMDETIAKPRRLWSGGALALVTRGAGSSSAAACPRKIGRAHV